MDNTNHHSDVYWSRINHNTGNRQLDHKCEWATSVQAPAERIILIPHARHRNSHAGMARRVWSSLEECEHCALIAVLMAWLNLHINLSVIGVFFTILCNAISLLSCYWMSVRRLWFVILCHTHIINALVPTAIRRARYSAEGLRRHRMRCVWGPVLAIALHTATVAFDEWGFL